MSKRVETGDVVSRIRGRPPIEYLRKLAPTPEEAEKYLALAEKAEIRKLSELGKEARLFDVYIPLLGCKLQYGLIAMNEIVEWEEAGLDLGQAPKLDEKTGEVVDPGKPGKRADQIVAMRKLVFLMMHRADPALTEETVGEFAPQVITQILVAISEHTPFFAAAQPPQPPSSMQRKPAS